MKSSFRTRIFQLLLLFAVIPAVVLTLFGYYLTVKSPLGTAATVGTNPAELAAYYHALVYEDLERATDEYLKTGRIPKRADFLLVIDGETTTTIDSGAILTPDAVQSLRRAVLQKKQGLVDLNGRYGQYTGRELEKGRILLAGLVHDSSYTDILAGLEQATARRSTGRRLWSSYVVFIGGLFLTVTLLTIIAAYFFSSRVSRRLARPLTALSDASRRIAAGDFKQSVPVQGDGEIAILIENFNRMASELETATTRLAQTERVAAWRQVARRFAHELKNPLQPILVSLYRIEKQIAGSEAWEEIKEPLRAASEEVKHLTDLAERFSTLARLPEPKPEPVDLADLIRSVVRLYEEKLKIYRFQVILPSEKSLARTDASYLREALHNLLQNSIDACSEGQQISLELRSTPDRVDIIVSDSGKGMDTGTLAAARLPYFTTKEKGTGLGLAIVEKSISELGGQLQVTSQPGQGTRVTISLQKGTEA